MERRACPPRGPRDIAAHVPYTWYCCTLWKLNDVVFFYYMFYLIVVVKAAKDCETYSE